MDKVLICHEKSINDAAIGAAASPETAVFTKKGESATVRLIRTCSVFCFLGEGMKKMDATLPSSLS